MENWGAIVYDFRKGLHSRERALVIARSRLRHVTRGSVGYRTLRTFVTQLERPVHFVAQLEPPSRGTGWSDCGRLVPWPQAYDDTTKGRDEITCRACLAHARRIVSTGGQR